MEENETMQIDISMGGPDLPPRDVVLRELYEPDAQVHVEGDEDEPGEVLAPHDDGQPIEDAGERDELEITQDDDDDEETHEDVKDVDEIIRLGSRFQRTAQERRDERQEQRRIDDERRAFEEASRKAQEYELLRQRLADDPVNTLSSEFGLSFNDIAQRHLRAIDGAKHAQPLTPKEDKAYRELQERIDKMDQQLAEREAQQNAQNIQLYKDSIARTMQDGNGEYTTIRSLHDNGLDDMVEKAFAIVNAHYEDTGRILTPEDALYHLERYYAPRVEAISKPKGRGGNTAKNAPKDEGRKDRARSQKTLTNDVARQPETPEREYRQMTLQERAEETKRKYFDALRKQGFYD